MPGYQTSIAPNSEPPTLFVEETGSLGTSGANVTKFNADDEAGRLGVLQFSTAIYFVNLARNLAKLHTVETLK